MYQARNCLFAFVGSCHRIQYIKQLRVFISGRGQGDASLRRLLQVSALVRHVGSTGETQTTG